MRLTLVITVLSLLSCTKVTFSSSKLTFFDTQFEIYIEEFKANSTALWPPYMIIGFGDTPKGKVARCKGQGEPLDIQKEITVNKDQWVQSTVYQKEAIIFHELTHCVLNQDHSPDDAISFMRVKLQESDFYLNNRQELFENLFKTTDLTILNLEPEVMPTTVNKLKPFIPIEID